MRYFLIGCPRCVKVIIKSDTEFFRYGPAIFIQSIENGEYDEQYDLDSYDSIDVFLEEFGNEKKELVKEEAFECPEYPSENGKYVITVFVGEDKVCEKVI